MVASASTMSHYAASASASTSSSGGLPAIAAPVSKISEIFRNAIVTIRKEMEGIEQIRGLKRKEKDLLQIQIQTFYECFDSQLKDQWKSQVKDFDDELQPL